MIWSPVLSTIMELNGGSSGRLQTKHKWGKILAPWEFPYCEQGLSAFVIALNTSPMVENKPDCREFEKIWNWTWRLEQHIQNTRHEMWSSLQNWEDWKSEEEHLLHSDLHEREHREDMLYRQLQHSLQWIDFLEHRNGKAEHHVDQLESRLEILEWFCLSMH